MQKCEKEDGDARKSRIGVLERRLAGTWHQNTIRTVPALMMNVQHTHQVETVKRNRRLGLPHWIECFSLGREVDLGQVREIAFPPQVPLALYRRPTATESTRDFSLSATIPDPTALALGLGRAQFMTRLGNGMDASGPPRAASLLFWVRKISLLMQKRGSSSWWWAGLEMRTDLALSPSPLGLDRRDK